MEKLQFPLQFNFKITTLSNDFIANDATGNTIGYIRQKMLRLLEEVQIFNNQSKSELNYTIRANKWLDFTATYTFTNKNGREFGYIIRKGWRSIWKAHYEILNQQKQTEFIIREANPWAKIFDSMLGEIPFLGLLSGYLFHPAYNVFDSTGLVVIQLKKLPSFWGRKFSVEKFQDIKSEEEERVVLGLMMLILLERRRG